MALKSRKPPRRQAAALSVRKKVDTPSYKKPVARTSSSSKSSSTREERIDLRVSPQQKVFLNQAAEADQKKLSAFMLDTALKAASEILTDRRIFNLSAAQWAEFNAILDRPAVYKPNLAKLLTEKGVFD